MAGRVDYRKAATVYELGRALPSEDLERWRCAIAGIVSASFGTVLDLGSGTGIFTRAWSDWGARAVIACEPSAAMRKVALEQGLASNISMLAGRAEQLPLVQECVDIMWLSTVVHHISDLAAWAAETHRVLKPGGWVLIRNLFADLGTTSWLAELPGAELVRQVFPTVTSIAELLAIEGLDLVDAVEVPESNHGRATAHEAVTWIRMMRKADSLLLALSDEQIDVGLERLGAYPEDYALGPAQLGLVVFRSVP